MVGDMGGGKKNGASLGGLWKKDQGGLPTRECLFSPRLQLCQYSPTRKKACDEHLDTAHNSPDGLCLFASLDDLHHLILHANPLIVAQFVAPLPIVQDFLELLQSRTIMRVLLMTDELDGWDGGDREGGTAPRRVPSEHER